MNDDKRCGNCGYRERPIDTNPCRYCFTRPDLPDWRPTTDGMPDLAAENAYLKETIDGLVDKLHAAVDLVREKNAALLKARESIDSLNERVQYIIDRLDGRGERGEDYTKLTLRDGHRIIIHQSFDPLPSVWITLDDGSKVCVDLFPPYRTRGHSSVTTGPTSQEGRIG